MPSLKQTDRTRLRRVHQKGSFDRAVVYAILDAQPQCFVGYVREGLPYVTPTFQWRDQDRVYWHGSSAGRTMKSSRGAEVCLTVSILDGLVLARSGFNHSVHSRSVMLFGWAEVVPDSEKEVHLSRFIDRFWPGRAALLRPISAQELKATMILSLPIEEGSAKIKNDPPTDDEADYALPIWAGTIPIKTVAGSAVPDPKNLEGIEMPAHVKNFKWPGT